MFFKSMEIYGFNLTAETKGEFVTVRAVYTLPGGQTLPIDFAIDGAGRCDITMTWLFLRRLWGKDRLGSSCRTVDFAPSRFLCRTKQAGGRNPFAGLSE